MTRKEYLKAANEAYNTGRVDEDTYNAMIDNMDAFCDEVGDEEEEEYEEGEKLPMKILKIEPGKKPEIIEIEDTLENLKKQVGGCIEVLYPFYDMVALICNEEARSACMLPNRALRDEAGKIKCIITGPMLIAGLTEDGFKSMSPELMKKYEAMFHTPECFYEFDGKVFVSPIMELDIDKMLEKEKPKATHKPARKL